MSDEEAVLLTVRASGRELDVAALADVPLAVVGAALAALLEPGQDAAGSLWTLAPDATDAPNAPDARDVAGAGTVRWPADATLRTIGVLDGTTVVLVAVSAARS